MSGAEKLDHGATNVLNGVMQVDKFKQFDKLKQGIKVIQDKAEQRSSQVNDIMDGKYPPAEEPKTN